MNRAAATLLASILAASIAACGPEPVPYAPYTDVTFYWQFRDGALNVYGNFTALAPGCDIANVDQVRVTLNSPIGSQTMTVPCIATNGMPGATFTDVPTGPYTWTLEGRRLGFTVFVTDGGGDVFDFPFFYPRIEAIYPNMDLLYVLPTGLDCFSVSEILFELDNIVGGVIEYSSNNVYVACRPPPNNGFTMPSIPVGDYGYRYVAAVNTLGQAIAQECRFGLPPQAPIVQVAPSGTAATSFLSYATVACP
jgi:hypothetical protein